MIQLVVVYQCTKYQHFILDGSGDIFDKKVLRITEGLTDEGRTDGRTESGFNVNINLLGIQNIYFTSFP